MYYDRIIPMKEELSIDIIGLAGAYSYALDCIEAEYGVRKLMKQINKFLTS